MQPQLPEIIDATARADVAALRDAHAQLCERVYKLEAPKSASDWDLLSDRNKWMLRAEQAESMFQEKSEALTAVIRERLNWQERAVNAEAALSRSPRRIRDEYRAKLEGTEKERDAWRAKADKDEAEHRLLRGTYLAKLKAAEKERDEYGDRLTEARRLADTIADERDALVTELATARSNWLKREKLLTDELATMSEVVSAAWRVNRGLARSRSGTDIRITPNGSETLDGFDLLDLLNKALTELAALQKKKL